MVLVAGDELLKMYNHYHAIYNPVRFHEPLEWYKTRGLEAFYKSSVSILIPTVLTENFVSSSYSLNMAFSSKIVDTLREFLARPDNEQFLADFKESFQTALTLDIPQFKKYGIRTFDDYINYYESYLTWIPTENNDGTCVYNHICMFYVVLDLNPVSTWQTPIVPSGPWMWLSQWIIDYAQEMGKWMDTPDSLTPASLQSFRESPPYCVENYIEPDGGWKTFNEFFAREIKPELRPIDSPKDDLVIVSPADSAFDGSWDVDDNSLTSLKGIPWSISQLLADTQYGERFTGGKFCHSFLGPTDYHRQHAPVRGTVIEAKIIPGLCYLEVGVEQDETGKAKLVMRRKLVAASQEDTILGGELVAPDSPGYQFLQARALILIDNPTIGLVAVMPIGMAQVSSVVLTVKEGDVIDKGQEISYFQLGGSDCVMVFQQKANVEFTADLNCPYKVGNQIAKATVN
ncbi:hypothetical protein QCA50_013161 [Cerrena zonata]|uniref:Phosphatidylserine decarboxylase n=1 Tax=Cerrena zonata TaxID=2478898 RepID=A0AAW0G3Z4_9APHY